MNFFIYSDYSTTDRLCIPWSWNSRIERQLTAWCICTYSSCAI